MSRREEVRPAPAPHRAEAMSRRACLAGALGLVAGASLEREARALPSGPTAGNPGGSPSAAVVTSSASRAPVIYLSHGAPIFAMNDPARIGELRAWGATLAKPSAILAVTPHYASRRLEVGATGRGFAMYDLPRAFARRIPRGLDYATPPSEALAMRVESLLATRGPTARGERRGMDHTTWMPLMCLFPGADVPVLELAYPYVREQEAFAIGRQLAPLRDAGVLLFASGGMTHNLAAMDFESGPPRWASEFDSWAAEAIAGGQVDALVDWRQKAPAVNLAHPDDGGHFRVLLVALGVALGDGGAGRVTFPVTGFEATMSKRSVQIA
jgi:4,5-DOPA dioxygenase extradiol